MPDHMRKTISWLRRLSAWLLWEIRFFWVTILVLGVAVVVVVWWPRENIIRYAGLGLQLMGILTVWWGIRETRKLFDHPTFWMQARRWFGRFPKYGGRVIGLVGSAVATVNASARASVWKGAGASATLEKRVGVLEENLTRVRDDLAGFRKITEDDIRKQDKAIKHEEQARHTAVHEISEKLKVTETGGLHISAMGALWLLAGVTMGTIPTEIASILDQLLINLMQ